jgi:hypothetical protein
VNRFLKAIALAAVMVAGVLASVSSASAAEIDFSTHGQGPFDSQFYGGDGVVFTQGSFVGYVQGDEALIGPAGASVKKGLTRVSARVAPSIQGTATYTLAAYKSSQMIGSRSVTVTQDEGDPATSGFGYFTIELGPLYKKATSFRLSNSFVRSSFSHVTEIQFGLASITLSSAG